MSIEENVEKLKMTTYKWTCPKCEEVVGPEVTKKKILKVAKDHMREEHEE